MSIFDWTYLLTFVAGVLYGAILLEYLDRDQ